MRARRFTLAASLAALSALALLPRAAWTQATPKKLAVLTFDQSQVSGGFNETFGRADVNVGRSLANLVARRLGEAGGFEIIELPASAPFTLDPTAAAAAGRAAGADAVVAGSILAFGTESGTAGVGGPRIGGVRLGIGRRTTVAAVSIEARLIDVASGTMLGLIPAQASGNRSGLALFVRVPGLIGGDGIIDMTRQEFSNSLLGEATNAAVATLVRDVSGARDRIGQVAVAPPAAPVMAAPMAVPMGPVVAIAPGAPFAWTPYRFRGTEHFRYTATQTERNRTTNGFYQMDLQPAGAGQVRMRVEGQLGEDAFTNTVTIPVATEGAMPMQMGFGQLMAMGPLGITLFNPGAWMFMYGHELTIGDEWSSRSGGESYSVKVESACEQAGQSGVLVVNRENGQVRMESCVSPNVALPLRVLIADQDSRMEMVLTEYRP